jgi:hypothetical protein
VVVTKTRTKIMVMVRLRPYQEKLDDSDDGEDGDN